MDSIIFLAYAAAYIGLLIRGARIGARSGWARIAMLPLFVVAALAYDNLVLGAGSSIGKGALLERLNAGRYWLTVFTPLLYVWSVDAAQRASGNPQRTSWMMPLTWLVAAAMVVVTYVREIRGLDLMIRDEYGSLSYISSAPAGGIPLVPVLVSLGLLIAGGLIWKRQGWPWLFAGSLLMTVASAINIPVASNAATNLFELLLLTSILATTAFQDRTLRTR